MKPNIEFSSAADQSAAFGVLGTKHSVSNIIIGDCCNDLLCSPLPSLYFFL